LREKRGTKGVFVRTKGKGLWLQLSALVTGKGRTSRRQKKKKKKEERKREMSSNLLT